VNKNRVAVYCERLLLLSFVVVVNRTFWKQEKLVMKSRLIISLLLLCGIALWATVHLARGQQTEPKAQVGYRAAADADQKKTLLLKDFHPVSMLHAPAHNVDKAKYYVIDVHNHVNDAMGIDEHMPPERVVQIMDNTNVKTVVILTGMWRDKLQHVIDEMVKPYPGRFIVFSQIDFSKIDDPNFSQEMVAQLDDAVRRGARGLKQLKDLGLTDRDKSGKLIAIDDPRLDPIWEEAGRLGIPVSIHTSDPEAFFHPIDNTNERYEELTEHPDWSFYGPQFPSKEELLAQRDRMFAKHPHTTFVALHVANWPENLDYVSQLLESGRGNFSSSIRTGSCSGPTTEWMRPCTAIIFAGWKPATSISITGGPRVKDGGGFLAWSSQTRCWKRFITRMQSGCSNNFAGWNKFARANNRGQTRVICRPVFFSAAKSCFEIPRSQMRC
jgi:predicted TIM-barrel fold metal-dependent hydrolase